MPPKAALRKRIVFYTRWSILIVEIRNSVNEKIFFNKISNYFHFLLMHEKSEGTCGRPGCSGK